LLNAIDGVGSAEGQLLIMTTNAPDLLDKALYRPGRIDRKIFMDFSNKITAECTFKRLYGTDPRNKFKKEVIEKWAKMFAAQVPSKTFTPAELANYIIEHRGKPQKAIEEFKGFLNARRSGKDGFQYDINNLTPEAGQDEEIPDTFDFGTDPSTEPSQRRPQLPKMRHLRAPLLRRWHLSPSPESSPSGSRSRQQYLTRSKIRDPKSPSQASRTSGNRSLGS
jgi:hypothetical protein